MEFIKKPMEIENKSMEIIAPYLKDLNLKDEEIKVYSRIIHAAGDVEYAPIIRLHPQAISAGKEAIKSGCNIFTDVEMVRTGINKRKLASFGGEVFCRVAEPEIIDKAKKEGITRSMAAMRSFGEKINGSIVAIGNAPTALYEVLRMVEQDGIRPALIVGIPVGFVGAADSKAALAKNNFVPYVTVEGTKGGSPIAAAVINAIMYIIDNNRV
ncbi:precorrin-8X methylmutase [uncultured Anaerovibrio sp.]|uniref:precorrin-8X methylmutase n=1 Tax=uncultured Anaerovibrio sp. TaxID=361586 RepID=UPI00262DE648|nr:precorrin-8X methylmutase [uncultured Anaerovibrio sp.]